MILSLRYRYLCLLFIVLAIYYPALQNPFNPMDDMAIATWLINLEPASIIQDIFKIDGNYFRPILTVSYVADKYLWGISPSFMHLENILVHAANVMLLFSIAARIYRKIGIESVHPAFAAGLLFALHPVNTESVNWIAGRSDLLAGCFFLAAFLLLVIALERDNLYICGGSFFLMLLGVLAKETALFFMPSALILIFCYDGRVRLSSDDLRRRLRDRCGFYLVFLSAPAAYFGFRFLLNPTRDPGLSLLRQTVADSSDDLFNSIVVLLSGTGFYVKKLIWPFPLNFAIFQVPGYYVWAGIVALCLIVYFVHRRDTVAACYLMSFTVLLSALLALVVRPGWTPVAERYLYIPSACFALGISASVYRQVAVCRFYRFVMPVLVVFFIVMAGSVMVRNLIWQDNIRLFQDVVKKSPDFPFARSVLAGLLLETGRTEEGSVMIRENIAPPGLRNADFLDLKRAELLMSEGRYPEARSMILENRRKGGQLYYEFQKLLLKVDLKLLDSLAGEGRLTLRGEITMTYEELVNVTGDPFYLYQFGLFYMREGDRVKAGRNFRLAAERAPQNATYKLAAGKLAAKMATP